MKAWAKHPVIYEINTWAWLQELGQKYKSPVTLAKVPREEWDGIADLKVDAVWFMGVWGQSPAGITIANQNKGLLEDFRRAISDFRFRSSPVGCSSGFPFPPIRRMQGRGFRVVGKPSVTRPLADRPNGAS